MARPLKPCGTWAAYMRHKRRGEDPCSKCREAARDQKNGRKAAERKEHAERRLAAVPEVEVVDPDPLEVARSNLAIIEATLFSDSVSASAIKGLTERREQLVEKILELSAPDVAEVRQVDAADAKWTLEAI